MNASATAFYQRIDDDVFAATDATTSPWDEQLQHGGPPAALLAWAIADRHPREDMRIARVAVDFLGGIPRDVVRVRTRVLRPGRRIELAEGTLEIRGRESVVARVWRVATRHRGSVQAGNSAPPSFPPLPPHADEVRPVEVGDWGYGSAIEWRFAKGGGLGTVGPSAVWTRLRIPLVEGVPLRPIDRLLVVADSANGMSAELPFNDWLFVPPSLSIALQRYPEGEWIFMDARSSLSDDGLGVSSASFADERGFIGYGSQVLYVEARH